MVTEADENWTSRAVYRTLCRLFRIKPPFDANRPLSPRDFAAIQAEYVSRAAPRELHRRQPGEPLPLSERARRAYVLSDEIHDLVQTHCVGRVYLAAPPAQQARMRQNCERSLWATRLLFADSAEGQARARRELRALLRGRPTPIKSRCRELLRVIPSKSRKQMGWVQEWLGARCCPKCGSSVHRARDGEHGFAARCPKCGWHGKAEERPSVHRYRAERQFLWAFLKGEARDADSTEVASDLARAYPFLRLTAKQIAAGLTNPHQADEDTARYFGRRSIRDALSRRRRAARRTLK